MSYPISKLIGFDDNLRKYMLYKLLTLALDRGLPVAAPDSLPIEKLPVDRYH